VNDRLIRITAALVIGLSGGAFAGAHAQDSTVTIQQPTLSLAGAQQIGGAIIRLALERGDHIAVAIVDAGGNLIYFERMDGAVLGTIPVALNKANTAIELTAPTQVFADRAQANAGSVLGLLSADYALMGGGRPVSIDGHVVGAVAISGATSASDDSYALAGLAAIGAS
jgi:glc operon protein GlcG